MWDEPMMTPFVVVLVPPMATVLTIMAIGVANTTILADPTHPTGCHNNHNHTSTLLSQAAARTLQQHFNRPKAHHLPPSCTHNRASLAIHAILGCRG